MPRRDVKKESLELHRKLRGKLEVVSKRKIQTARDLSLFYTPGVGAVSAHIAKRKSAASSLTAKGNMVAVVSDGSAVLGLGNIGPEAALPVMEGKAVLFKTFAGVDAFPIVLDTQDTDKIVQAVQHIAPSFGGINLEDIKAPKCFEVEERLKKALSVPVMHDDQHGTAIVVLAGLLNACSVAEKNIKRTRVVVVGAGAAGVAIAKLLHRYGVSDIVVLDSIGVIAKGRSKLPAYKKHLVSFNKRDVRGGLPEAAGGADVLIGVSGPQSIGIRHVQSMAERKIVFALANPVPEIFPEDARKGGAGIIATGRSDYPNQVNNSLVFPGVFRGALDNGVRTITDAMKVRAAEALSRVVKRPTEKKFIPGAFDKGVVEAVSSAIHT